MDMCRACLSTGMNMIPMDETFVNDFNRLTNLNIKFSQNIPLYTCEECLLAMNFCNQFRNKCIESDNALREIIFSKNDSNSVNIEDNDDTDYKYEIKLENNDDIDWRDDDNESRNKEDIDMDSNNEESNIELKTVECGLCPEMFKTGGALLEHLALHRADNVCMLCQHQATSDANLLAHRMKHVTVEQSGCLFCIKVFMSTSSLEFHYMTSHKSNIITDSTDEDSETEEKVLIVPDVPDKYEKKVLKLKYQKAAKPIQVGKDVIFNEKEIKQMLRPVAKGVSPFFCGLCPLEYDYKHEVIKHLSEHKNDTSCSICELKCISYPNLLAHRMNHVPSNQNGCLFCDKIFRNSSSLEFHYLRIHKLGEKYDMPYLCRLCLRTFETSSKLRSHKRSQHSTQKYTCDDCSKSFSTRSSLTLHMVCHSEDKIFKCDMCDFRCKLANGLKEHKIRRHVESRVYCNLCGRVFMSKDLLDKHMPCKTDDVVCPLCGLNLKPSSNLARHLRTHTDVARFECDKCPAKYKSKSAYSDHMNKHNDDRKYSCEFCPKSFFSHPVLIKHRRIHTGERPYVCRLCSRAFTGNHNLKVHMKVHGLNLITKKDKNKTV